ncbi:hypothetical protein EMIHUDRAFT_242071 [Emiliania huxleyi CCMP1516]|uniref:N-acetyltransferase domain-containing protein n=2 Tax=Emiliania huxleyi TaxID=2903 RepID=A0A0D3JA60_EMIH1|nr:hypothetical protein EMIHUDRAFT_242071 [Emiliania huxleyi CCMP1516]EOD20395.1 hypothetical protein EMIHUDRAFT_242071 [Emiliania huxleyi CCMP1516]|eukprot:XP_005772824.1 hypothetical protein EMIHUDRAFT_242071 [Emiliania huxleyi CCMP1516]
MFGMSRDAASARRAAQRQSLAARLLRERFGGREVTAVTLATNAPMLSFLAGSGFERTGEFEDELGRQVEWRLALRGAAAGEAARVDAGLARYVGPFLGENLLHRASSRSGGAGGTTWQPVTDGKEEEENESTGIGVDDCPLLTFPQLKQALGADPEALPAARPKEALLLLQLLPVAADSPAVGSGAGAGRRVQLQGAVAGAGDYSDADARAAVSPALLAVRGEPALGAASLVAEAVAETTQAFRRLAPSLHAELRELCAAFVEACRRLRRAAQHGLQLSRGAVCLLRCLLGESRVEQHRLLSSAQRDPPTAAACTSLLNELLLSPAGDLAARAAPASFAVEAVVAWRARAARSSQPLGASRCCWPPRVLRDRAAGYVRRLLAEEGAGEGASLRHAASLARQLRLLREVDCEALLRRLAASNLWAVAEQLATAACATEPPHERVEPRHEPRILPLVYNGEEQREESRGAERETAEGDGGRLLQLLLSAAHQRQNARLVARLDPLMRRLGIARRGTAAAGCSAGGEHAPRQLPPYTLPAGTEVASYEGAAQSGLADAAVASLHLAARASRLPVVGVDAEWVAGRAVSALPLEKQWFALTSLLSDASVLKAAPG